MRKEEKGGGSAARLSRRIEVWEKGKKACSLEVSEGLFLIRKIKNKKGGKRERERERARIEKVQKQAKGKLQNKLDIKKSIKITIISLPNWLNKSKI